MLKRPTLERLLERLAYPTEHASSEDLASEDLAHWANQMFNEGAAAGPEDLEIGKVAEVAETAECSQRPPLRAELLQDAELLITSQRNKDYGPPTENFANTAAMWTVLLRSKLKDGEFITPVDVANLMAALKLARTIQDTGNYDTYVDIAGYAACAWECECQGRQ